MDTKHLCPGCQYNIVRYRLSIITQLNISKYSANAPANTPANTWHIKFIISLNHYYDSKPSMTNQLLEFMKLVYVCRDGA